MENKRYCKAAEDRGGNKRRSSRRPPQGGISGNFFDRYLYGGRILLASALILSLIGVLSVFVATSVSNISACRGISKVFIQAGAVLCGVLAMLIISRLPLGFIYKKLWWGFLVLSVALLVLTLRFGSGPSGTKSWLTVPGTPLSIQTSEFVKLMFIISFAGHLRLVGDRINKPLHVLLLLIHAGAIAGIVVLQHDLGSALVYLFVALFMCYFAGMSGLYFAGGALLCLIASPLIWHFLSEYQRQRILVGFSPELDPLGYGYQVLLSKNAVISGFPWGSRWLSLEYSPLTPALHTDMIFSVISEQFGIVAVAVIFICYSVIVFRLLSMAGKCGNTGRQICAGVAAVFIIQAVENIGMCLGVLPVIGVTLPLVSYGGSSVLSLFAGLGIAVSAYRYDRTDREL